MPYKTPGLILGSNIARPVEVIVGYPSGLRVSSTTVDSISLSWQDNSTSERYFIIERRKSGDSIWEPAGLVSRDRENWTDNTANGITPGETYYYKVFAVEDDKLVASRFPDQVMAKTDSSNPYAPYNLTSEVITDAEGAKVKLSWIEDTSIPVDGYLIYRSINHSDSFTLLDGVTDTYYYDTDIMGGDTYSYTVVAYNGETSTPSDIPKITLPLNNYPLPL